MDTSGLTELFLSDTGERPGEIVALSAGRFEPAIFPHEKYALHTDRGKWDFG